MTVKRFMVHGVLLRVLKSNESFCVDETCYTLETQYMFGDDIISAPIVEQGQTTKTVYIPDGEWILTKDKKVYTKGTYEITAEIDEFIAFVKKVLM